MQVFERLHREGLISDASLGKIKTESVSRLFSVYWELRTILYVGILMLAGGLSILVYKNIDTIGHQVILAGIAAISFSCFLYCTRKKTAFSAAKVETPTAYYDYILLLGCLTLLTFIGYLQVQYTVFGEAYGLATFIPMVLLFFVAYYFDHLGILSMAITNLGAWLGIAVTPLTILRSNNLANTKLIIAGLVLGVLLVVASFMSEQKKIKAHFSYTYINFGMNIVFISCLAGMFQFDSFYLLWIIPLSAVSFFFYKKALSLGSFYFIFMISVYSYIGISYAFLNWMNSFSDWFSFALLYFIASGIGMILFLISMNKKIKNDLSLPA